jgi:hypothetical protein
MGMEDLKKLREALDRVEGKEVAGLRVRTPRARLLDAREVQAKHPDKHVRWVSIRDEEKAEARKEDGYQRLTSEEGGKTIGKELTLMAIPKAEAEQRIADNKKKNEVLLNAHKATMEQEAESAAKYLRDSKGMQVDARELLISE